MVDATTTILMIFFAAMVLGFFLYAGDRTHRAYRIRVKKDFRNPLRPPRTVYAIFNKNTNLITIYNRLLSPLVADTIAYFEPGAYADKKSISCYQGISGLQGDNNLVPIGNTLMSEAMCEEQANLMQDSIINRIKHGFKYKEMEPKLDARGLPVTDPTGKIMMEEVEKEYKGMNLPITEIQKLAHLFSAEWVLRTFGVINVQNANLLLQHHKVQIAAARSITARYRDNNLSWFAKNQLLVAVSVWIIVMSIATVILWDGLTSDINSAAAGLSAQNNQLSGLVGPLDHYLGIHQAAGTTAPTPNTTASSNGTQVAT